MEHSKLVTQVGEDWATLLAPFMVDQEGVETPYAKISTFLSTEKDNKRLFYPPGNQVFRAFRETPLDKVRVVLLGQDPYPKGFANGLAFATDQPKLPVSLAGMFEGLEEDGFKGLDLSKPMRTGNLSHWASQGVLLLNTALTVGEGEAGSHSKIWAPFTEFIVEQLNILKRDVIWLSLGAPAKKVTEKVNPFRSFIFLAEHPAFAAREKRPWKHNNIFSKTNMVIKLNNLGEPIKW